MWCGTAAPIAGRNWRYTILLVETMFTHLCNLCARARARKKAIKYKTTTKLTLKISFWLTQRWVQAKNARKSGGSSRRNVLSNNSKSGNGSIWNSIKADSGFGYILCMSVSAIAQREKRIRNAFSTNYCYRVGPYHKRVSVDVLWKASLDRVTMSFSMGGADSQIKRLCTERRLWF